MLNILLPILLLVYFVPLEDRYVPKDDFEVVPGITRIDNYADADGYYLFVPTEQPSDSMDAVVFVHGFGAINPMVYGGWIEHIVSQKKMVIYVRYQEGMISTPTTDFVPNTSTAISNALLHARNKGYPVKASGIDLIGHSYGGVISANIAANWRTLGVPQPRVAFLCEPGSGPFTGGVLESYEGIDSNIHLAIVVGDDDFTVGQTLGLKVLETAINTPNRVLFWQYADENGEEEIGASHYEPYSYDDRFDNEISNFTVSRASNVSSLDAVDFNGYWQIYDSISALQPNELYTEALLTELADLGSFKDGSPIRPMEIRLGE